ncbi:MAG: hypothetical protein WCN95_12050 [bacterium]
MTTAAVLRQPAGSMRIRVSLQTILVAQNALTSFRTSVMALGAMLTQPSGAMRIGMSAYVGLVTGAASSANDFR